MKKSLFVLALSFVVLRINAQIALPNPGFENWTSAGNYEDPDDWHTLNPSTAFVGVLTALKANPPDVHSGSFAIKLTTKTVFGQTANGIATTGTIDVQNQTITGGLPYTLRPDSISGWYMYTPAGGDNGFVDFVLLDNANDTVGFADFTTPSAVVSTYTYFTIPIVYRSAASPSLSRFTLSSSAGYISVVNSTMFIDDLSLIFNPNKIVEHGNPSETAYSYRSTSNTLIFHSLDGGNKSLSLYNSLGQRAFSVELSGNESEISVPELAKGPYIVRINSSSNSRISVGKIIIN